MIAGIHAIGSDRTLGGEICRRVDILRSQGVQLFLSVTGMPQQVIGLSGLTPAKMWNGAGAFFREANGDKREMLLMETAKQIAAVGGASSLLVRSPFNASTGGAEILPLDQAAEQQGYTPEEFIFQQLCRSDGETAAVLLTRIAISRRSCFPVPIHRCVPMGRCLVWWIIPCPTSWAGTFRKWGF